MDEPRALTTEEWEFWDLWTRAQRRLADELDRGLQEDCGISKAEFSVLMTLWRSPDRERRVGELAESLGWEKSRVAHMLTRMENRGFVHRTESGASGRRTGVGLTAAGRSTAERAVLHHGANIRRHFLDGLAPAQAAALRTWSRQVADREEPGGAQQEA
ncbi:MarR family winged helix-turn-helix transcriptional regulator [Lentzea sp.]|uniref:MarR family winged helix-turn-helix transcriptional regulator n=1 Tax=Lentzea sp. TaxID=56099 RepID=UPI002D0B5497|nr:MarR family winged helix-turn-helix transcriptional regulator [Lentzea sp.]HUQ55855.1 MarR family winged helix-turn-helix transcriptional regulator [Lentzea sp.]